MFFWNDVTFQTTVIPGTTMSTSKFVPWYCFLSSLRETKYLTHNSLLAFQKYKNLSPLGLISRLKLGLGQMFSGWRWYQMKVFLSLCGTYFTSEHWMPNRHQAPPATVIASQQRGRPPSEVLIHTATVEPKLSSSLSLVTVGCASKCTNECWKTEVQITCKWHLKAFTFVRIEKLKVSPLPVAVPLEDVCTF